jgi:hypothetical protein
MASQENACWSCGTPWPVEAAPPTRLRVLPGGKPDEIEFDIAVAAALPVPEPSR